MTAQEEIIAEREAELRKERMEEEANERYERHMREKESMYNARCDRRY